MDNGGRWTKVPDRQNRPQGEKANSQKSMTEGLELVDNSNGIRWGGGPSCNPDNPKSDGVFGTSPPSLLHSHSLLTSIAVMTVGNVFPVAGQPEPGERAVMSVSVK